MVMSGIKIFFCALIIVAGLSVAGYGAPAGATTDQTEPPAQATPKPPEEPALTDIHDIRHPEQVGVNPAIYYWAAGGVAALAAAVAAWLLIRRRMKRGGQTVSDVTATVYRNPEEEALENLAALENNMPDSPAVYYFRLSAVFRAWLKRRFNIDAPEMTTEELLPRLVSLDIGRDLQPGLREFLKSGDQVKFARVRPASADMARHLALARQVINSVLAAGEAAAGQGGEA